jgi:hypothetical protein
MPKPVPFMVRLHVLKDYFDGMRIGDIVEKYGVSKGYVYTLLQRTGRRKRNKELNKHNWSEASKRSMRAFIAKEKGKWTKIPYAGKDWTYRKDEWDDNEDDTGEAGRHTEGGR